MPIFSVRQSITKDGLRLRSPDPYASPIHSHAQHENELKNKFNLILYLSTIFLFYLKEINSIRLL